MKRLGKLATAGATLTITAILAGCGTSGNAKVPPTHHIATTSSSNVFTPSMTESNTTNSTVQTTSGSGATSGLNASANTNTDSTASSTATADGFNGNNSASNSPNSVPTVVIESIEPQPSGLLIKLDKTATSAMNKIVQSPHFGDSDLSLSFTLQNVQVASPSIDNFNTTVGNQLIQNLKVQNHGTDLIVSMTLTQPVNKINIGTSGSYLGIALQYKPSKPMPEPHPVGQIPSWFFEDMLIAASTQGTPVRAVTYAGMLPFQSSDKTYMLKAPQSGAHETLGFSGYFGNIPLEGSYLGILNANSNGTENLYSQVKYGFIREKQSGKWYGVKAIMVNMQNGWQLGFAKNQVIVENNHAGFLTYTVYPVQGVELGAPLQQ